MPDRLVIDASAVVDLLLGTDVGLQVELRLRHHALHAPAHLDAEVLSALGRLHRAGQLDGGHFTERLGALAAAVIDRHPLAGLLAGAWSRGNRLPLVAALYVELAEHLGATLVTTDARLAATGPPAELVGGP